MSWGFSCGGIAFALPEQGCQVVSFAENGSLSDVIGVAEGVKMEQAARQLQIRIGDVALGVAFGDQVGENVFGPLEAPKYGLR